VYRSVDVCGERVVFDTKPSRVATLLCGHE